MPNDQPDDLRPGLNPGGAHGRGRLGSVIRWNPKTGKRHLDELIWGLLPHGTKDPETAPRPINARAETVATHSMFAAAFRDRRAIVPMTVYYQWRTTGGSKQVFAISRRDGEPMAVAGLWEAFRWRSGEITRSYCIITTEPNALVASIHDRMPVVLEKNDWPVWLGEQPGDPSALLRPPAPDILQVRPASAPAATPRRTLR